MALRGRRLEAPVLRGPDRRPEEADHRGPDQGAKSLGLWEDKTWGDIVEDRGSQITFSALGQEAPVAEKSAWDPDGEEEGGAARLAERVPELEVRAGGSTSVDVTARVSTRRTGCGSWRSSWASATRTCSSSGTRSCPAGTALGERGGGRIRLEVRGPGETQLVIETLVACSGPRSRTPNVYPEAPTALATRAIMSRSP